MAKSKTQELNPSEAIANDKDFKKYVQLGVAAVVLAVLVAVGVGYYQNEKAERVSQEAEIVYQFETDGLKSYEDKKINGDDLVSKALETIKKVSDTASFLPTAVTMYSSLAEAKFEVEKLIPVFTELKAGTGKTNLAYYQYSQYLAVLLEESKRYEEGIVVLKEVLGSPYKYEEKLYFDLGRLHYLNKQEEQAKTNLNHVIEKFPDSQFAKMSKVYLSRLDGSESK